MIDDPEIAARRRADAAEQTDRMFVFVSRENRFNIARRRELGDLARDTGRTLTDATDDPLARKVGAWRADSGLPTVARSDERAFLRSIEEIAAGRVKVV